MIESLFHQPNLVAAKRLLDLTALRQEAITGNLANLETPGYRRVDVPPAFERELRAAIASRDTTRLERLRPNLEIDASAPAIRKDGNTVDLESELLRLHRNSLEHSVEAQMVTSALLKLRLAITGRPA